MHFAGHQHYRVVESLQVACPADYGRSHDPRAGDRSQREGSHAEEDCQAGQATGQLPPGMQEIHPGHMIPYLQLQKPQVLLCNADSDLKGRCLSDGKMNACMNERTNG